MNQHPYPPKERPADGTAAASGASPPATVQGNAVVTAAYAVTIFGSAFLLFQVQPLISKFILPWFGGSPAVWTAAMLFFQSVLFGGYLYAHLSSTYLPARGQFLGHLLLLAVAASVAVATRISPSESLRPTGDESSPLWQVLMVLGATVGVPYFALSSTGPLLQKWFSDAFRGVSPYRLFALSNVGSLLALLSYPFFFEVHWDSHEQAWMWSLGFVAFAGCCAFCAYWTYRARRTHAAGEPQASRVEEEMNHESPGWTRRAAWIGLPALASVMFLAVTNEVCQNVAPVPLLWIIPLSLYLISFIVAFDHPRWYLRPLCAAAAIVLLVITSDFSELADLAGSGLSRWLGRSEAHELVLDTWTVQCVVYFLALFVVCLICHCELAGLKPSPRHLTAYFLSLSLGGALGGVFVGLLAPHIFTTFFEMPLSLLVAAALAGWPLAQWASRYGRMGTAGAVLATVAALGYITYCEMYDSLFPDPQADNVMIHRNRNFFGLVSVQHRSRNDQEWAHLTFRSGHIPHGKEYCDPARRSDTRLAYWGPDTGCRLALEYKIRQQPHCRIGVVGLGVGTLAAFAKPTDYVRLYEINPQVTHIAKTYFHFLENCPAPYDIVHGDARLKLEQELLDNAGRGHQFDVLCLDAFSGDAVPTHLLTQEAFATYRRHLKPDGIIVCNITNTYLDLWPVVKRLADEYGLKTARVYRPTEEDSLVSRTYYALLTNDAGFLGPVMDGLRQRLRAQLPDPDQPPGAVPEVLIGMPANFQKVRDVPLWTDRYHNLLQVLR